MEVLMDECLILVDNANVFVEGRRFSANKKVYSRDIDSTVSDFEHGPIDWRWRLDFGALINEVANECKIIEAVLIGIPPPSDDSLWTVVKSQGFSVKTYDCYFDTLGKLKTIDIPLAIHGTKTIVKHQKPGILKLLSGDEDLLPLIQLANEEKWETELWGFSQAIPQNLANAVTRVKTFELIFDKIGKYSY